MFEFNDEVVDNHIKVMLGNFDVEPYVYLLEHKLMLVYDNLTDEVQVMLVLIRVDDVHDDIHLNVDYIVVVVVVLHYQYYVEIPIMNNVLHRLSMVFLLIDDNHNFL
jgi:hypothetical protein